VDPEQAVGRAIMRVFPKGIIGWVLWMMHGFEAFILTIFLATICGLRVEYGIYGERLIVLNCLITAALIVMSIIMLFRNKLEANAGLATGVLGIAMVLWLLPALY
jgi:hypothetical protein